MQNIFRSHKKIFKTLFCRPFWSSFIFMKITLIFADDTLGSRHIGKTKLQNRLNWGIKQKSNKNVFSFFFLSWNFFVPGVRNTIFVVSFYYPYIGVLNSQFWVPKHTLGMLYTGRSTTLKKRAIKCSRAKIVPGVCTYMKNF